MSELFLNHLKTLKERLDEDGNFSKPYKFLFLAYIDVHAPDQYYTHNHGSDALSKLEKRPNTENLKKIHGCGNEVSIVPTLKSAIELIFNGEVEFDVFDFEIYEGSEIRMDLNDPVPKEYHQRYDAVIDQGTTEHIFDYPQVLRNCATLVKEKGYIFHGVPMNLPNHGFYNISPTLYYDFYGDNGFTGVYCMGKGWGVNSDGNKVLIEAKIHEHERFSLASLKGIELILYYIARKDKEVKQFVNPIQRKYRDKSRWM
jgi:SAM-dependent methyltransferase